MEDPNHGPGEWGMIHDSFPALDAKASGPDQERFVGAIIKNFEECRCHPVLDGYGFVRGTHVCPAHTFMFSLNHGKDEPTTFRRFIFLLRLKARLVAQEFMVRECPTCHEIHNDVHHTCKPIALQITQAVTEGKLPW